MPYDRKIRRVAAAYETLEGGGIMIGRGLPNNQIPLEEVDPFLLLDEARIDPKGPGFPEHPHRGFEIITYFLGGWGSHKDNLGNQGRVEAGGLMKLTAGSGITHGEEAGAGEKGESPIAHGIQFWVNLPLAEKKRKPEFQLLQSKEVPETRAEGSLTRVLVGEGSPVKVVVPMTYLDVTVQPGQDWQWELSPDWQGYAYVLDGKGHFGAEAIPGKDQDMVVLGEGAGLKVHNPGPESLRFLLAAGLPLRQPIRWWGPYVD